jgi:hypothetical protein
MWTVQVRIHLSPPNTTTITELTFTKLMVVSQIFVRIHKPNFMTVHQCLVAKTSSQTGNRQTDRQTQSSDMGFFITSSTSTTTIRRNKVRLKLNEVNIYLSDKR